MRPCPPPVESLKQPDSYEFAAMREARRYRNALLKEFRPYLRGRVLEVGAGVGQLTELLVRQPGVQEVVAVEPNAGFCEVLRAACPGVTVHVGTVQTLPNKSPWDSIVCVNVLEHIPDDETELEIYSSILRSPDGRLCLFVPAGPEIYAPIDRDLGHYRRYRRHELRNKLERAGFIVDALYYFNCVGYVLWWLNFCVLRRRRFSIRAVRLFDKLILPGVHLIERRIARPPIGQSLIAIARVALRQSRTPDAHERQREPSI